MHLFLSLETRSAICFVPSTGYVFPNAAAISPYLEEPQTGPTSRFCENLARRLRCYVTAGYPEVLESKERGRNEDGSEMVGANSAALFSPDGAYLGGYRKTNLFMTDKTWAKPGDRTLYLHML